MIYDTKRPIKISYFLVLLFLISLKPILASTLDGGYFIDFKLIEELNTKNKNEMQKFASELELKWRVDDPTLYAQKMKGLCLALYSTDVGKNNQMPKDFSKKAVDHLGDAISEIPVTEEIFLLLYACETSDTLASTSIPGDWFNNRRNIVGPYFLSLARFFSKIDPGWDINQPPANMPELPINKSAGFRYLFVRDIKDPALRKEYEALLKERKPAAKKYYEQFALRKFKQVILPEFRDYFILLYSYPYSDPARIELDAFKADLSKYVKNENIKSQIMDIVLKPKEQLYTLREEEEKIAPRDITKHLLNMSEWESVIQMPEDEQMASRIKNALTSARQLWKEFQDLVNSRKIHFSEHKPAPKYGGSLRPEGKKISYSFVFRSAAMDLSHCIKRYYEDEAGRNVIHAETYELIFCSDGSDIKYYRHGYSREQIHFYPGNKIKTYVFQIEEAKIGDENMKEGKWYSISWDQNGRILEERTYAR
jgi:hypothetical protein